MDTAHRRTVKGSDLLVVPMIMDQVQKGILSSRRARFQVGDIVGAMRPLTKLSRRSIRRHEFPPLVLGRRYRVAQQTLPRCL